MPTLEIDVSAIEALGFRVSVPDAHGSTAYILNGPRGAIYGLMRNQVHPDKLFLINRRNFSLHANVRGYSWFTDRGGKLRPLS